MLQTGLEAVAYNLNRKNNDLRFYEFGKTYATKGPSKYEEYEHLCLYVTGDAREASWKAKAEAADLYYVKGIVARILQATGIDKAVWNGGATQALDNCLVIKVGEDLVVELGMVPQQELKRFDIKQQVFFADIRWETLLRNTPKMALRVKELPKQLPVRRDLAMIVPRSLPYADVESTVKKVKLDKLQEVQLFDIFESEKLGADKKSLAVSFTFLDEEKTPTDKEIDGMMTKIMTALEKELSVEIRK